MKIVTFGELMIRLQPYNYERFVQADHLELPFGGGEANVAVSLANYGMDAAFVTKLPAHTIGQCAVNSCAATVWIPARSSAAATVSASTLTKGALKPARLGLHLRPRAFRDPGSDHR